MYIFLKTPYSLTYSEMINTINTMNIIYFLQQERKGLHICYFNPTITKRNRGTMGAMGVHGQSARSQRLRCRAPFSSLLLVHFLPPTDWSLNA